MIEYNLIDKEGNIFELNGSSVSIIARNSTTFLSEQFQVETKTEENSFLPGKVKIGDNRLLSRTLPYVFQISEISDYNFNTVMNTVLYNLEKAEYLIDNTNNKRIRVNLVDSSISYDVGSHKRSADVSFSLECLTPYWEDSTEQTITGTTTADTWEEIAFNNSGFMELFPIIELEAAASCSYVELVMEYQSVRVEDSLFGTTNYEVMIIDNKEGYVKLGIVDRTVSIVNGLGFISVPVGSNTLELLTELACSYTLRYRRRYYL